MSNEDSQNKNPRPYANPERSHYRFQDYGNAPQNYVPVNYQQEQMFRDNYAPLGIPNNDEKHLDQLSLGFKIYAGINALFSSFPIFHLIMGIMMLTGAMGSGRDAPPPFMGVFFIVFALIFMSIGYGLSACNYYAGKFLKERRNYTFCFVMSCINCAFMPLGTVLGVFGILVLVRDSVKHLFQQKAWEQPHK